jgi:uncharacterized membrane protein YcaP (DUF421 family)
MQQQLHPFDLYRLFIGQSPGWFMIEVIVRIVLIYLVLMVAMRMMGKRVAAQMSVSELAVIVTLGAAVGVPMQVPDRGMLPAILILAVAVLFQRGLAVWGFKNRKVEVITHGDVNVLVQDGRIFLDEMRVAAMSRERLFALLRARSIEHLGQVRRVYLETSGDISVYQLAKPKPGLSVLPEFDDKARAADNIVPDLFACTMCGALRRSKKMPKNECEFCENTKWGQAVEELSVSAQRHEGRDGDGRDGWTSQPDGQHRERAPRH